MKPIFIFTFSICFVLFLFSCKTDSEGSNVEVDINDVPVPEAPEQIPDKLDSTIFSSSDWVISHVMDNGQMQDGHEYIGSKLVFDEDGNFSWVSEKYKNEGRWSLDISNSILLLESSDPDQTSEWTVKHKRSVMVWVGTSKYGHHSIQMMMNKVREFDNL